MLQRLRVNPHLFDAFPEYAVLVVYATGLRNGPSDQRSVTLLRDAAEEARATFEDAKPATHPHIAAWREAFGRFGAKPSKYPCSAEALLSRTLRGQELPAINQIVDIYNAVSVRHVLPAGGEDWDQLSGVGLLTFATGYEPFVVLSGGQEETTYPEPGEVIWRDEAGVTCRRWNWRQCGRTQLTEATQRAYFVLDRLPPVELEHLQAAGDELVRRLRVQSPGCDIETALLSAGSPM